MWIALTAGPGGNFVRVALPLTKEGSHGVRLTHQAFYAPGSLVRRSEIREINLGESVTIGTNGDDDAWFGLNAKASVSYVLRTHNLRAVNQVGDVDTLIEVYDTNERRLASDDDSGEGWASRLVMTPDRDTIYRIRLRNISSSRGRLHLSLLPGHSDPRHKKRFNHNLEVPGKVRLAV